MYLARDLLDNQAFDTERRKMSKIDDAILVLRRGRPPRLAAIEIGLSTVLSRIHPRVGAWGARLERRLGVGNGEPVRIDPARIARVGLNVEIDIDATRTEIYAWERWIRRRFIDRIPWHGGGGSEAKAK